MNLQHLRYFLAVARTGGFTQAVRLLLEAVFAAYGGWDEWLAKSAAKRYYREYKPMVLGGVKRAGSPCSRAAGGHAD